MSKTGEKIIESLESVQSWTKGEGTMRVTLPGQEPREMTIEDLAKTEAAITLVKNEVGSCMSSMVVTLAKAHGSVTGRADYLRALDQLMEQACELAAPVLDYEGAAREAGWSHNAGEADEAHRWSFKDDEGFVDYEPTAEDACRREDIEPHELEVYEHWAVSQWLANKLIEAGERVDTEFAGLCVWARTSEVKPLHHDKTIMSISLGCDRSSAD